MTDRRRSLRLPGYDYSQPGIYFITLCAHGRNQFLGEIINKKMILNLYGRIVHSKWMNIPKHFKNAHLDVFQIMPDHLHGIIILTDYTDDGAVGAKHRKQESRQTVQNFAGEGGAVGAKHRKQESRQTVQNFASEGGAVGAKHRKQESRQTMQNFASEGGAVGAKHREQESRQTLQNFAANASPLRHQQPPKSLPPNGTKRGSISAIMQNFSSVTTRKINQIQKTPGHKIWQPGFYEHIIRDQNALWAIRRYISDNPSNWNKQ